MDNSYGNIEIELRLAAMKMVLESLVYENQYVSTGKLIDAADDVYNYIIKGEKPAEALAVNGNG